MKPGEICYLRVRVQHPAIPWPGDEKRTAAAVVLVSRYGLNDESTVYYVDPQQLIPAAEAKK